MTSFSYWNIFPFNYKVCLQTRWRNKDVKWESNQPLGIKENILSLLKYTGTINTELMKEKGD